MWADHETNQDLLGFGHLVQAVVGVVNQKGLLPATIGVYGDWGSGKSSLLKMVEAKLAAQKGVAVLSFNGWLFEGYDDAKVALMETILDEISARQKLSPKGKKLILKLLRRVNWFRVAGTTLKYGAGLAAGGPVGLAALAGMDVASVAKKASETLDEMKEDELSGFLKDEAGKSVLRGIREFRADFGALIGETDIDTLVVIIDDLDRCLPETIIETLEAIKLFLFVPQTAFILGADERLVEYAVRRRFPELPGEKVEVGRDYLEKLVQFPVRVPPLGRAEMQSYISLLFLTSAGIDKEALSKITTWGLDSAAIGTGRAINFAAVKELHGDVPAKLEESLVLTERISPILATELSGNPRQCKRFLNTLMMRLNMAESRGIELSQRIMAKLMLLEYFRPQSFRMIAESQAEEEGRPRQLKMAELLLEPVGKKAEEGGEEKVLQLDSGTEAWFADAWRKHWTALTPALRDVDLRPYFYFSRDKLGPFGAAGRRLSPRAQDVLQKLLHESAAIRTQALNQATEMSPADASAVFEELASRVRQADDLSKEGSPLTAILAWVEKRTELLGELLAFLGALPDTVVPVRVVPRLVGLCRGSPTEDGMKSLFRTWEEKSSNTKLRTAAQRQLKKL